MWLDMYFPYQIISVVQSLTCVCRIGSTIVIFYLLPPQVIVRRQRQIKQMKGLRDTKVLTLIQQKPECARLLFPRQEESELNAVVNFPY